MPTLAEIKEITLLHTNDIESVYEPIDAFYNTMWKGNRKGLTVKDPTEIAQKWADKIRDDVDMILVLTHQKKNGANANCQRSRSRSSTWI